ncbi:MAG: GNAT family N-acetyltransferase [Flavipsychrobacter sp.]
MTIATTERLLINTWQQTDIPHYAALVSNPEVMRYIGDGHTPTYEEAKAYVLKSMKSYEDNGWSRFPIFLKETEELIGFCGYMAIDNRIDFGWRLAQQHWGKGYATEAAKAVLKLGINLFHFPEITCVVYQENIASIRVIEKLGIPFDKDITLNGNQAKQYVLIGT